VRLLVLASLLLIVALSIGVGTAVEGINNDAQCRVAISKPLLNAITYSPPNFVSVHRPYLVAVTLVNHCDQEKPFIALFEVRDADGVTRSLDYEADTLETNGFSETGLTWWPDEPGDYELRAFVISNFTKPEIMTELVSHLVEIRPPGNIQGSP